MSGRRTEFVIRAGWIVPMLGPPIPGGAVRIRGSRVAGVSAGTVAARERGSRTVDLPEAIVMPGLVNAHTHLEFSDTPAPLDAAGGLPAWIGRVIALRRSRGIGEAAAAIGRGLNESAEGGVTAIGEIATGIPAGGYPTGGPRLRVFREALALASASAASVGRRAVADVERLVAGGVPAGLSPHAPYSVSVGLGRLLIDAARRRGAPLAMHLAESDAEDGLLRRGTGPFRDLFERLGVWPTEPPPALGTTAEWISLLARGPRAIVVHGTHLDRDPEALARLARHRDRLCVVVCPRTTQALSGRLPPVGLFREAGVRVAIGTDSRASTPDLSVLAECRVLADAGVVSAEEAVRMATRHGAWALGFERTSGTLAAGRPADVAILAPAAGGDPFQAVLDPATRVMATLRSGRVIAGRLPGPA
ncbi:MAG: amidohydrolase family protein [Planctomycetaceae bacterium]